MKHELVSMPVSRLSACLQKKEVSSAEAAMAYLSKIEETDEGIGAYLAVTGERALEQARKIDERRAAGDPLPPLAGIPMGVKDNICTKGTATTCASKMLEHFIPPYNASVMERLNSSVLLGKLNMDEFAMGSTNENSAFKPVRNPRDLSRVPGGSSGGAAAAVAAGEAAFTLGSDTGGSIRQPAAFCGVVGMKPTYGTVSRYGLIAFASSLDQIGPLTRDVRDSAMVLEALTAHDERDTTSIEHPNPDFTSRLGDGVKGMRIALPEEYFGTGASDEVQEAVKMAAERFERLGTQVEFVKIPSLKYSLSAYYIISSAEASSNLARFDGVKYGFRSPNDSDMDALYRHTRSEGFGEEVKRRIMLGSFVLSAGYYDAYYKKALQVRTLLRRDLGQVFDKYDFILGPVSPTTAYRLGEKRESPLEMYMGDVYTVPVNIAGVPALSLPCGEDAQGLPIGMQLIGKAFSEALLYRAAYAFEQDLRGGCAL